MTPFDTAYRPTTFIQSTISSILYHFRDIWRSRILWPWDLTDLYITKIHRPGTILCCW